MATIDRTEAAGEREVRECACGCGRMTGGRWYPGHDALMHAEPRCYADGCTSRIPSSRTYGPFHSRTCAAAWAIAHVAPGEWSVPQQAWIVPTPAEAEADDEAA